MEGAAVWNTVGGLVLCALALFYMQPSGLDQRSLSCMVVILVTLCLFMLSIQLGHAYCPAGDTAGLSPERGMCVPKSDETEDELVRSMYAFSSYPSTRTDWPPLLLFSFIGAVFLASVLDVPRFAPAVCVAMLIIYLVHATVMHFTYSHNIIDAQTKLDNLYCRFRTLRALNQRGR